MVTAAAHGMRLPYCSGKITCKSTNDVKMLLPLLPLLEFESASTSCALVCWGAQTQGRAGAAQTIQPSW